LIDSTRAHSPLRQADDAIVLDNSEISRDEQFEMALSWARERIGN
jgi:cytidylate kinase